MMLVEPVTRIERILTFAGSPSSPPPRRLKPLPASFCQTLGSYSNARTRLKPSLTTFPFLGMKTVGKSCMGAGTVSLPRRPAARVQPDAASARTPSISSRDRTRTPLRTLNIAAVAPEKRVTACLDHGLPGNLISVLIAEMEGGRSCCEKGRGGVRA